MGCRRPPPDPPTCKPGGLLPHDGLQQETPPDPPTCKPGAMLPHDGLQEPPPDPPETRVGAQAHGEVLGLEHHPDLRPGEQWSRH